MNIGFGNYIRLDRRLAARAVCAAALVLAGPAAAVIPLEDTPWWRSVDEEYATGGAFADLDGDGWLDLVVANGNDMASEADAVFYNRRGELEAEASWRSGDFGYDGHLDVGDVDGDGDADVVIAALLDPELEQLYENEGGQLSVWPVWRNAEPDNSFSCALGDVDGDGDLDLAAAGHSGPCILFENVGGVLNPTPAWSSSASGDYNQLTFGDVDGDGWRDMVASDNRAGLVELYRNVGGTLEGDYRWSAPINYASCVKLGDADGDGDLDLAAGGWWAPLEVFENVNGSFAGSPAWSYYPTGEALVCEQAMWGDVDNDGLRFIAAERYDGDGSRKLWYLANAPLQEFVSARVEGRTLAPAEFCYHLESGWVSLARAPRAGVGNVEFGYVYSTDLELAVTNWDEPAPSYVFRNTLGGVTLSYFRISPGDGALELSWAVGSGGPLAGFNVYRRRVMSPSYAPPIIKVNDGLLAEEPYVFRDGSVVAGAAYDYWLEAVAPGGDTTTFGPKRAAARATAFALGQSYPNPARGATTVPFTLAKGTTVTLELYDLAGRRVATLCEGFRRAGAHAVNVDVATLAAGVYLYQLRAADGAAAARKMVVTR